MRKKQHKSSSQEYWQYPNVTRALEIALYYGFTPNNPISIEKSDREYGKSFETENEVFLKAEEKAGLIRTHLKDNTPPVPIMIAAMHDEHRSNKIVEYTLDVLNTNRSIADASLLKAIYEIARGEGYKNIALELNSIGDRDSFARYARELGNYYRKNAGAMHNDCKQIIKKNIHKVSAPCTHPECQEIKSRAPHSMNFLSEPSRCYFSELLELLEMSDIPYSINNNLLANPEFAMHTIFRITENIDPATKPNVVAYGSRWGLIAKKMGFKKDIQSMSGTVLIKRNEKNKASRLKKPQCYFIQMGQEAKLKSLKIIEILRQSKIQVYHSLTKDKLTAQLSTAETLQVPYIMIMGQKESLENTVLIRAMDNRSQETVRIEQIAEYLKKIFG